MEMETVNKKEDPNPDLDKICLLCLKENSAIVQIFDTNGEKNIPLRIMACTSLEVSSSGSMPKLICLNCRIQLEKFYYFRKRAQYSYNKLKKHIRLVTAGKKSHVFEKNDDDDDEIDFTDSLDFLKAIEKEENLKRQQELHDLEEQLKGRFRVEETNRIFEEARNFLNNKVSEYVKSTSTKTTTDNPQEESTGPSTLQDVEEEVTKEQAEQSLKEEDKQQPLNGELPDDEKIFKFTYSDTNDDGLESFYLINPDEVEEIDINAHDNAVEHIDETTEIEENAESSNAVSDFNIDEEMEENDSNNDQIETINLDDCSLEGTIENSMNMFEDKSNQDIDNLIEDTNPVMEEDGSSNQSQLALATVIERSLLSQDLKLNGNIKFKMEQIVDGVTHVKVVTEEGNVIDIEVNNENETESLIEKNEKNEKNEELKIFKCSLCPQAFTRRSLLQRHKSVHVKSTGYCCRYCQKWFACKSSMNRHVRVHTGEKPFECDQCGRRFIQKEILKRHMVVHTGVRPYPCPHCNKAFVQKQLLRQHINLKHSENPVVEMHECFLCPKSFCHASGLSRHLLVHSGVSYQCKKCGKKFNDKSAVKRHTMTVHAKTKVLKIGTEDQEKETVVQ